MNKDKLSKTFKSEFIEMVTFIREHPFDSRAWLALGDVLTIMHLDDEAVECLRWGITLNSILKEASATRSEVESKLANFSPSILHLPAWGLGEEEKRELESAAPNWLHNQEALEELWARSPRDSLSLKSKSDWQAYEAIRNKAIAKVLSYSNTPDGWLELGKFVEQWEPYKSRAYFKIALGLDHRHIPALNRLDVPTPKCRICDKSLYDWQGKIWCPAFAYDNGYISELIVTCLTCQSRGQAHHLWGLEYLYQDFFWVLNCVLEGVVLEDSPRKSWSKEAVSDFMELAAIYLHESPAAAGWLSRSEGFLLQE